MFNAGKLVLGPSAGKIKTGGKTFCCFWGFFQLCSARYHENRT